MRYTTFIYNAAFFFFCHGLNTTINCQFVFVVVDDGSGGVFFLSVILSLFIIATPIILFAVTQSRTLYSTELVSNLCIFVLQFFF